MSHKFRTDMLGFREKCYRAHNIIDRRALLSGLGAVLSVRGPIEAEDVPSQNAQRDEKFMRGAIELAKKADFPFGAIIVADGKVLAEGLNMGRRLDDPTAHAEMVAIRRSLSVHGSAALRGTTIYTTGEPCAMCMGAILWCRMSRVVFAASLKQIEERFD